MQVSGYSGFDILMQLTKNADGTINYKAYNKTKIIFDKLKSVDKKFPNISPTKKQSILEENFYTFYMKINLVQKSLHLKVKYQKLMI